MKNIFCFAFVFICFLYPRITTGGENEALFKEDGSIVSGNKKLYIDKNGIPILECGKDFKIEFTMHLHIDTFYATPDKLSNRKHTINHHYKIFTFSSDAVDFRGTYMSEILLKDNGIVSCVVSLYVPSGYYTKYVILKPVISITGDTKIMAESEGKMLELKADETVSGRIFSNVNKINFPGLRIALNFKDKIILARENSTYYIHWGNYRKIFEFEIDLNSSEKKQ